MNPWGDKNFSVVPKITARYQKLCQPYFWALNDRGMNSIPMILSL